MRTFVNVDTIEHAKKILNEFNAVWDVSEHYESLEKYCFTWKDHDVADFLYAERKLILY